MFRTPKYPLQTYVFGRKKKQGGTTTGFSAIVPEIQFWPKKTRFWPKMATAWCKLTIVKKNDVRGSRGRCPAEFKLKIISRGVPGPLDPKFALYM